MTIAAQGLTVRGPRGPVFENVDAQVEAGGLLVVHGPPRSGRTSLLLALSGRMRLVAGTLRVGPYRVPGQGRRAAGLVAVARAEPAVGLEGRLRVRELIAERCWISRGTTRSGILAAADRLELALDESSFAEDLSVLDRLRLALALAAAGEPGAVAVDDVDRDCTGAERSAAWRVLSLLQADGPTVLAAALQPPPAAAAVEAAALVPLPRLSRDLLDPPPAGTAATTVRTERNEADR
ncbi:ABC transporter ATP-binding protein [Streptacidiphilus sp. P02-A3a]|uniref:ABC transporter ATP-binding protein n=1 Tax=Streptacidiphilus sp. P02-A3a TaxID=2704468 RepID=UPI0015FD604A|nr:ABC transporter ATP-binding protein [Streptacidiphilus sp. P02-A3a]QMU71681.1 ABC transporter ATP-binding protein [Streptacidiphilus sp. P02-A3a]